MSNSRPASQVRPALGLYLAHGATLEIASGQHPSPHPWPPQPGRVLHLGANTGGSECVGAGSAWLQLQLIGPSAAHWPAVMATWM